MRRNICTALFFLALGFNASSSLYSQTALWPSTGPDGGDARSFANDPTNPAHLYVGTTSGWVYESIDGGAHWSRLAQVDRREDLVLDNLVVDAANAKRVFAGAWVVDHPDGGLYLSEDSGQHWSRVKEMDGQSIRALAQAPSDAKTFIAGTIAGVFRSEDSGLHWTKISPPESKEIHEIESIAIDPKDPNVIYAGTWHLPWKTTDGGKTWQNIKQGVIDDSDVFSIIVDPAAPLTVYASACSGIYKSTDGGSLFHKVQGIPSTARRTRVLMQDPKNHDVVYAGTTEGLYRTTNAGKDWQRITAPNVIVNDVYVDPSNTQHVLLATDRSGVQATSDGGLSFTGSNAGFSQRQVLPLLKDSQKEERLYAGVINDKLYGGVFVSEDSGKTWAQQSIGLEGRDVYSLAQAEDGTLLAGTNRGVMRWNGGVWAASSTIQNYAMKPVVQYVKKKKVTSEKKTALPPEQIAARVDSLAYVSGKWFAATEQGLYTSDNAGAAWQGGPVLGESNFSRVAGRGGVVLASSPHGLYVSGNGGEQWSQLTAPAGMTEVRAIAVDQKNRLWVAAREGLYFSEGPLSDNGSSSWQRLDRLPVTDIGSMVLDGKLGRLMVTSRNSTLVFAIDPEDRKWKWIDAGWSLHGVQWVGGRLVGATLYDGVVLQPPTLARSTDSTQGLE